MNFNNQYIRINSIINNGGSNIISKNNLKYIENQNERQQLNTVRSISKNTPYFNINFLDNPSITVIAELIKANPFYILKIDNPDEELILLALRKNGELIHYIKNPTEGMYMACLTSNPYLVRIVPKEKITQDILNRAVYLDARSIIGMQLSKEQKMGILKKNPLALTIVVNGDYHEDEEITCYALSKEPSLLRNIPNPTEQMKKVAIKSDHTVIQHIIEPTEELLITSLKCNDFRIPRVARFDSGSIKYLTENFPQYIDYIDTNQYELEEFDSDGNERQISYLKQKELTLEDKKKLIKENPRNIFKMFRPELELCNLAYKLDKSLKSEFYFIPYIKKAEDIDKIPTPVFKEIVNSFYLDQIDCMEIMKCKNIRNKNVYNKAFLLKNLKDS